MRLKNVDVGEGSLSPEQITEFIDQMQVYEGAMYEISTKLEILDSEFQVRFSHNPIHHMERRLKSLNSILGKLVRPSALYVGPGPRSADTVAGRASLRS